MTVTARFPFFSDLEKLQKKRHYTAIYTGREALPRMGKLSFSGKIYVVTL